MTPRDAFCHMVHDFGVDALAARMGVNRDTLQNKANPNSETHRPTVDDLVKATVFTGDPRIAHAFATLAGGVFMPTKRLADLPLPELYQAALKLSAEFGDVMRETENAIKDGRISSTELRRLQTEIFELVEAAAALGKRLEIEARHHPLRDLRAAS